MDSYCKELELNAELVAQLNEAQAIEAIKEAEVCCIATIKEAKVHHATAACILQQKEEGQDCQAFVKVFGVALQACQPQTHGALMYPLHF